MVQGLLLGRDLQCRRLADLIQGMAGHGGALAVRGETGAGKSALLAYAAVTASAAQVRVLATTGVENEQHLPYASLHQVIFPLRAMFAALPGSQRDALRAAIGLTDQPVPDLHLVGLAMVNLLAEVAAVTPVLVLVEDAHWLDPASADVLAFVTRRLGCDPVALVAAIRNGVRSRLGDAIGQSVTVGPLPAGAAGALLDAIAPELGPVVRRRLLEVAAGNPLALTELPKTMQAVSGAPLIAVLPLSDRLERTFTARMAGLPADTRLLLPVAALNDSAAVAEVLAAAARIHGTRIGVEALQPAVAAQLIDADAGTVMFRHPLMRSAISQATGAEERRTIHAALAEVLAGQADRRAWHRAAAATGTDEAVAAELEAAADRAQRRGGVGAAVTALEHAARLSPAPAARAERLLRAADLAVEWGDRDVVLRVLGEATALDLTGQQHARMDWIRDGLDDGMRENTVSPLELAGLAESVAAGGDTELAERILWSAALRCFWSEPGELARRRIQAVADGLFADKQDARLLAILAYASPIDCGTAVVDGLTHLAGQPVGDPLRERFLGTAALLVGMFDVAARLSAASLTGLRSQGRLGLLARALAVQAWSATRLGDLATATRAADEAGRLARETGQSHLDGIVRASQAEIAALRGDFAGARLLAAEAEQLSLAAGARPTLATVQTARGLAALGEGRFTEAFAQLRRLHDPADPAFQVALRCYSIPELAEAAVRSGRLGEFRTIVHGLAQLAERTSSPALDIGLRLARAVLAEGDEAEARYKDALSVDLCRWPLQRARVQLMFGEWLRRQRRVAASRPHLRAARETFDALGVVPWSERAQNELRAAGAHCAPRAADARGQLTAQELHIARLAAEGLTNRQIGQRLFLSHRTVGTHLHRIFPKLGVTARAELGTVMHPGTVPAPDQIST